MATYDRVADLPVTVDGYDLERRSAPTTSGFTRVTTVVSLHGDGETGRGEDVSYDAGDHDALLGWSGRFPLAGTYAFDEFSALLAETDLFPVAPPERETSRPYRRWAFESAALDLALRQADTDLGSALGRDYDPVRFVVSTRLGDDPTADPVRNWLDRDPALEFKLDPTPDWDDDLCAELAETGAVRILDFKGLYEGTEVDTPDDPALYRRVVESFRDAVLEDPAPADDVWAVLDGEGDRLSWDYPITSPGSLDDLPRSPEWLNVKPSRFGSVQSLFDTLDRCERTGVSLYGGGQFELDVGRGQLHALASLFYPDGPNDVAPAGYNVPDAPDDLPGSPLAPPASPRGFGWD